MFLVAVLAFAINKKKDRAFKIKTQLFYRVRSTREHKRKRMSGHKRYMAGKEDEASVKSHRGMPWIQRETDKYI
jgi:hypothetical protein